jgi:hypothetical protein
MNHTEELVRKLHALPGQHKAVLAITGGGAEVIGMLLRHGGGSNTLLEAVVPYDQHAFDDFVKGKPDKYCSIEAARTLAMAAYIRAAKLAGNYDVVGVGASCSLKKDGNERAGRQHQVFVAIQNKDRTGSYAYEIDHRGRTTREDEETFAAERIIDALVAGFEQEGVLGFLHNSIPAECRSEVTLSRPEWRELVQDKRQLFTLIMNRQPTDGSVKYLMPGAWNPMHTRHKEIAQKVHELHGESVDFELCIRNVDKPPISYYDMKTREDQVWEQIQGAAWAGNLHFTTTPTFAEKAQLFPGCTFIVGMDTFIRIGDLKYYGNDEKKRFDAIDSIRKANCRFLVFNRIINGVKTSLVEIIEKCPHYLNNLAKPIPDEVLPPSDMSSSNIRKESRT